MPGVINYKICDLAPECGGIEVCPAGALLWNKKAKRPEIDNNKCVSCGVCVRECPVGAIVVVKTQEEFGEVLRRIKNDSRSEKELWRERLGCQPGRTPPLAKIITPKNFEKEIVQVKDLLVVDVWNEETLDCRYHSILWEELGFAQRVAFKKLRGDEYPELVKKLKITKFPTLLIFKDGKEVSRKEGYLYASDRKSLLVFLRRRCDN